MFELLLRQWIEIAQKVEAAVEQTDSGADAIEALQRAYFAHYQDTLQLFMFCHGTAPSGDLRTDLGPGELEQIRPINDLLYGGAEKRLRKDQRAGLFPKKRNARRFVFTAHTAVVGLLNMMAIGAAAGDPLIHKDEDLINDICLTYRQAAQGEQNHA